MFAALLVGLIGLSLASSAFGQGAGASIEGVAKDQQGGVLPGVTVTMRNQDTGVTRTATTETDGRYRFLALSPGRYRLSAVLSGFTSKDVGDITLTIGLSVTQDLTMGIQTVQESVTVSGQAPTVDTTKSEVAGVVTQQQIQTLPVNSRQFLNLALLMPGTSQDAARSFYNNVTIGAGTSFYSNGFLVDGVNNTWAEEGEPRQNFPQGAVGIQGQPPDFPPRFGGSKGSLVRLSPRAGSNGWSGRAEYFRDKSLNALNTFEAAATTSSAILNPASAATSSAPRSAARLSRIGRISSCLSSAPRPISSSRSAPANRNSIRHSKARSWRRSRATCSSAAWIIR
jgi:hypothetical protein